MCSWALICALSAALSIIQVLAQDSPLLYAPQVNITCPTTKTLVRTDGGLSPSEISYVASRQEKVASSWKSWIGNGSQIGYDFSSLEGNSSGSNLPKLGIAMSGGGLKATQCEPRLLCRPVNFANLAPRSIHRCGGRFERS
jgi:hypothetical protein